MTTLFAAPPITQAVIERVTPELAQSWLDLNASNRNVRKDQVSRYARDMSDGNWVVTGEAIKFGQSGKLIDGQHRLMAIVKSGVTVDLLVIKGLPDDVQGVLDSGRARTAADTLRMGGYTSANLLAAVVRKRIALTAANHVSSSEVYDYIAENEADALRATHIGDRYDKGCGCDGSTVGAAAWAIADIHGWESAEKFFKAAAEKVGLYPGDPVLAMTAFFNKAKLDHKRLPPQVSMSAILRAYNYRQKGRALKTIKIHSNSQDGPTFVAIPVIEP